MSTASFWPFKRSLRLDTAAREATLRERPWQAPELQSICPPAILGASSARQARRMPRRQTKAENALTGWLERLVQEDLAKQRSLEASLEILSQERDKARFSTLSGDTATMPIESVLQMLRSRASNGILGLELGNEHVGFQLRGGRMVRGLSERPPVGSRLGEILVQWRLLDPRALERVLQEKPDEDQWLGKVLVQRGLATPEEVRCAMAEQCRRTLQRTQEVENAPFAYVDCEVPEPTDGLSFDLTSLLLDTARDQDEKAYIDGLRERLRSVMPRRSGPLGRFPYRPPQP